MRAKISAAAPQKRFVIGGSLPAACYKRRESIIASKAPYVDSGAGGCPLLACRSDYAVRTLAHCMGLSMMSDIDKVCATHTTVGSGAIHFDVAAHSSGKGGEGHGLAWRGDRGEKTLSA
jgi:hypothetical protein